jgi:hypothetical protein
VWVVARFTEEHRATLDWLNRITNDTFRVFGVEVELWKIGESPAAPKFNIVSKPNDWSHSVAEAAPAIDDADLSETKVMQREYWAALNKVLEAADGPLAGNRKPQPQHWMSFPIGRSGFHLNAVMIRPKHQVRAELYISGDLAKTYLALLKSANSIGKNCLRDVTAEFAYVFVRLIPKMKLTGQDSNNGWQQNSMSSTVCLRRASQT